MQQKYRDEAKSPDAGELGLLRRRSYWDDAIRAAPIRAAAAPADGATKNKTLKADETEKPIVLSLPEAAAKMDPSDLADFLDVPSVPDMDVLRFYFYFEKAFAQVSFPWVKIFNETPLSAIIDVSPGFALIFE
uniref:Uncharacterized protein n=2 Tax=Brassica oleracea TaxID=3712 RepID=A0A0D3D014_BRAOL|nr:unnamed protein product [Brassica oleracea]